MTRDDIIRMAREAGWNGIYSKPLLSISLQEEHLLYFAELVAAAEREHRAFEIAECYRCGWDGGVKAEREECLKLATEPGRNKAGVAAAIRARGEK